jgi:hypothetical protein
VADDTRGLKASRFMERMEEPRKKTFADLRDTGISLKIKAGLKRPKRCVIF